MEDNKLLYELCVLIFNFLCVHGNYFMQCSDVGDNILFYFIKGEIIMEKVLNKQLSQVGDVVHHFERFDCN